MLADSKLSKKKLLEIIPRVATHWREIGIRLLGESHLDVIKANHGHDKRTSCEEMSYFWLKSHPNASWHKLMKSLNSLAVQLHHVAADVVTMFTG